MAKNLAIGENNMGYEIIAIIPDDTDGYVVAAKRARIMASQAIETVYVTWRVAPSREGEGPVFELGDYSPTTKKAAIRNAISRAGWGFE